MQARPKFGIGQVVRHRTFDYRGVIVDVDPEFQETQEWYETMARSRPPKDHPWYHVLVDGRPHQTYVAERHLDLDDSGEQVEHPGLGNYFDRFSDGLYHRAGTTH